MELVDSSVGATTSGAESNATGIVVDEELISPLLQLTEELAPSRAASFPTQLCEVCRTSSLASDSADVGSSLTRLTSSASRFDASRLLLSRDSTASAAAAAVGIGDVLLQLLPAPLSLSVEFCGSCCCSVTLQLGSSSATGGTVEVGNGSSILVVELVEAAGDSCETRPMVPPVEYSAAAVESTGRASSARAPVVEESDDEDDDDAMEDAVAVVELTRVIPNSDCCAGWWWMDDSSSSAAAADVVVLLLLMSVLLLFSGVEFVCNEDSGDCCCCDVVVLLLLLLLYLGPFTEVADGDDSGDDFLSKILPEENRPNVKTKVEVRDRP